MKIKVNTNLQMLEDFPALCARKAMKVTTSPHTSGGKTDWGVSNEEIGRQVPAPSFVGKVREHSFLVSAWSTAPK